MEGGVTVGDLVGDVETVLERLVVEVAVAVVADDGTAPLHRPNPGFKRRGEGQQNLDAPSSVFCLFVCLFEKMKTAKLGRQGRKEGSKMKKRS